MVLLAIVARFNEESGNKCKVKISGGVNIQKLKWVGYAVSCDGVDKSVQDTTETTLASGGQNNALGFQGHLIPNQLVVNLDILNTNQIHIANPAKLDANKKTIENSNPYSNGLPLAMTNSLNTIQMGMGEITFDIAKTIHNEVVVEVFKYANDGALIPMLTGTPFLCNEDGVVDAVAGGTGKDGVNGFKDNIYGAVSVQSIILYFHYDFEKYF